MNIAEYCRNNPKLSWIIIAFAAVLILSLSVAIALGVQSHNDHVLAGQIAESEAGLKVVGAQISEIKDHDFQSMAEYIKAYAQIEPLTIIYDQKLQRYSDLYRIAEQRDRDRSLINIQRLYTRYNPESWHNASEIIDLVRQVNQISKKEASVIHDMSSLPESEQVQFWHEEFMPLAAQEHALRERLLLVGQRVSPERTTQ
jgi:hypothetical protein